MDGATYYHAVAEALRGAQRSIFIAGWYVTADLHLKRPGNDEDRLCDILKERAEAGVEVYVLLFQESDYYRRDMIYYRGHTLYSSRATLHHY